ncbi:MAG: hypothetical protein ACLFVE_04740, partial [Chitinispirillaceae bacterium]
QKKKCSENPYHTSKLSKSVFSVPFSQRRIKNSMKKKRSQQKFITFFIRSEKRYSGSKLLCKRAAKLMPSVCSSPLKNRNDYENLFS